MPRRGLLQTPERAGALLSASIAAQHQQECREGSRHMVEKPPIIKPIYQPEARAHRRARTLLAGIACYRDYSISFDCMIRDLTEFGARLRIVSSATLPSRFYLINVRDGVVYDAEVAWINSKDVGVKWDHTTSLQKPSPELFNLRRLWSARRPFLREASL